MGQERHPNTTRRRLINRLVFPAIVVMTVGYVLLALLWPTESEPSELADTEELIFALVDGTAWLVVMIAAWGLTLLVLLLIGWLTQARDGDEGA